MARPTTGEVIVHERSDGLTTYMIRIRAYGDRHLVRLGHEEEGWTPQRAERERQRIAAEVNAGIWVPPAREDTRADAAPSNAPSFHEVASRFLRRKSLLVEENTRRDLRWRITDHLLPYFAELAVDSIDHDAVFGYIEHKLKQRERIVAARDAGTPLLDQRGIPLRPLSNTSVNMTLATLAAILDEPECEPWVPRNPARGKNKRLKTYREKGNFLEVDELNALLAAAERLDRRIGPAEVRAQRARELRSEGWKLAAIADELGVSISTAHYYVERRAAPTANAPLLRLGVVAVLGLAGPRATEAARLRGSDVDLRRATINIADSKTETGIRVVHLSPRLVATLERVYRTVPVRPDGPGLPSATGTYRDKDNIGQVIAGAVRDANRERTAAGLPPLPPRVTPHTLRRTYITLLLEAKAPLPYVMGQVGHRDEKTVLGIYARVLQRQRRESVGEAFDRLLG
jgi:integrase